MKAFVKVGTWTYDSHSSSKSAVSTMDEERRDVVACLLLSLSQDPPDPDRQTAYLRLLSHLTH